MSLYMQNPGDGLAGASRNQLGRWLHCSSTARDWQAQILTSRFCLSPWMAHDVARLCFGEVCND
jgi:hypothetical protein